METDQLNVLKEKIECLTKERHIEILKILNQFPSVVMNENKSGVFINLSTLENESLQSLIDYMKYIDEQEENLKTIEYQKKEFEDNFFTSIK
jgi:hypothetical protein